MIINGFKASDPNLAVFFHIAIFGSISTAPVEGDTIDLYNDLGSVTSNAL
jgi:hypothetical protein